MQLFKLHKKIHLTILNLLFISGVSYADPIGTIIEQSGQSKLVREKSDIQISDNYLPGIELYDTAETANGRLLIEFLDKANLSLREHSQVYIDEIYYDPNPNLSKMSMRMVMGTARFASGSMGLVNKANIDIQTPTATIGIRGTDFTTTIDELGRSLVILLPDSNGDPSGEIIVSNLSGETILNEAYQAVMVSSLDTPPTQPVTIQGITPNLIDNMFIVNPPTEVREAIEEQSENENNMDQGILDVDFLAYDELDKGIDDYFEDDEKVGRIDVDYLAGDFLPDLLDVVEELLRTTEDLGDAQESAGQGGWQLKNAEFGFNKDSQYNIFEEDGDLVFYRNVNGVISVMIASGGSGYINTRVEGYEDKITFNGGDGIEIYINQTN